MREKWPLRVKDLPEHVVQAVLAAEDDSFYCTPASLQPALPAP